MPSAEVSAHSTTSTVARRLPTARHDEVGDASMVAESLSLGFAGTTVLEDVTLEVPRNRITALVGPSGSGKTTFLRSLNRMNDKVRRFEMTGRVLLDGCDIYGRKVDPLVVRRKVGMVFQRPNPFPMSIRDNVVAGARVHKMAPRAGLNDLAETKLAEVGLWAAVADRLNDSPFRLSGGQQQLLCLARALAVQPDVLLLDEPTSALDPISTEYIEQLLRQLTPALTLIIVTHNLGQARRISHNTMFLYEGELVEHGPTEDVFERSREERTQVYVTGRMG